MSLFSWNCRPTTHNVLPPSAAFSRPADSNNGKEKQATHASHCCHRKTLARPKLHPHNEGICMPRAKPLLPPPAHRLFPIIPFIPSTAQKGTIVKQSSLSLTFILYGWLSLSLSFSRAYLYDVVPEDYTHVRSPGRASEHAFLPCESEWSFGQSTAFPDHSG